MLFRKKKQNKISKYLKEKQISNNVTAFDTILQDYLSGCLKENLHKLTMERIHFHIDWLADYKCVNIQGKVNDYYVDIQIETSSFSIAYDKDEPEDVMEFVLEDTATFYKKIENEIINIK